MLVLPSSVLLYRQPLPCFNVTFVFEDRVCVCVAPMNTRSGVWIVEGQSLQGV